MKSKVPSGIMGIEKMQAVYWDIISADVFSKEFVSKDSTKNAEKENAGMQHQIFNLHKISKNDYYKSYNYYLKHQSLMKEMIDTMLVRQQKITVISKDSLQIE